ncbi:MAG: AAA family ATPase, partial [Coxiellaceae bacterium]|nr:AAA family ATPase [Coxiellaceae bacterium]
MANETEILVTMLDEFQEKLSRMENLVPREAKFSTAENKIKVAIGMRRSGKTTFCIQKIKELLNQGVPVTRILYINFEDDRLLPLDMGKLASLLDAFYSLYPENHHQKCYLFLDEVQNAGEWALVIRRFFETKNVEIYLTGSSAKLLSKEIATSLRGRSLATEIWPYSFKEYLVAHNHEIPSGMMSQRTFDQLKQQFNQYLLTGGFPEITNYESDDRIKTLQE